MARLAAVLAAALSARAASAAHDPVAAVSGLITRLLGADALPRFSLATIPADAATGLDVFEVGAAGALVALRGSSGTALAVVRTALRPRVPARTRP